MKTSKTLFLFFILLLFITACSKEENKGQININQGSGAKETFTKTDDGLCTIDGKPAIRLFSTTWCPHCKWIRETYERVVKEYADADKIAAFHWEVDTKDNTLTSDIETKIPLSEMEVFSKYNERQSIPTFVFGCKYARIGNGYEAQADLKAEEAEFRKIIDELISINNN